MGRPPAHGAPTFRFNASEVAEMESILREHSGQVPHRDFLVSLATKFSNSPDRAGKTIVQMKQVWNWFQNRRYALRAKLVKSPGNPNVPSNNQGAGPSIRNVPPVVHQQAPVPLGHNLVRNASENPPMEFEAKSARDGAWYDVQEFLSHRNFEADNPEVLVRFAGFGQEEDEWVNVLKHVRHRSLPCESTECLIVLPGDLILCFQEGKEQALYFDAHVLDAQRRRHDVRGCRCRFLVRYDHDQSEEIVPLRKICRRPDTDYRLQLLNSANESAAAASPVVADSKRPAADPASSSSLRVPNPSTSPVAFPSHTIVNPSAGVPHSTLFPAAASTPAPALITTPSHSLTSSSALAPAPSLIATPSQALTSDPAPVLAPALAPTAASAPAPAPTPTPTPASAPAPTPAQAQPPAPAPAPTLAPPEAQFPAAAPSQTPALAPAQVPALATHGAPASASATTPSLTPMSAPTPSSIVVSAPTPSMPIPSPDPTLTAISVPSLIPPVICGSSLLTDPGPAPAPAPAPVLAPAPLPTQILVPTPTILTSSASPIITKNTDSDNPANSSAGEASTREIITNPSVASMVMEDKKEEISIPGTSAVVTGGSSVLQGETSENPAVTVISQEKVDMLLHKVNQ